MVFCTVGVVPSGATRAVAVLDATDSRIDVYGTPAAESAAANVGFTDVAAKVSVVTAMRRRTDWRGDLGEVSWSRSAAAVERERAELARARYQSGCKPTHKLRIGSSGLCAAGERGQEAAISDVRATATAARPSTARARVDERMATSQRANELARPTQ